MIRHCWVAPLLLAAALGACGQKKPVTPPAPTPPSAALDFIKAFNTAENGLDADVRANAQHCTNSAAAVACTLTSAAPAPPLSLVLTLNGGAITATTIEGAPSDEARLFGALSAVAAAQGEPLATTATIAAFKRELGLSGKPKPDKPVVTHRTYADITCVLKDTGAYACTFAPAVTTGDLPPPQLTADHGGSRPVLRP